MVMLDRRHLRLVWLFLIIGCSAQLEDNALETNEVQNNNVETKINFLFDIFLKQFRKRLIEMGKTDVDIPGFEKRFSTKIISKKIEGVVIVKDGRCGNIATVCRTGDAELTREGNNVTITVHLGLGQLQIDYNHYEISFLGINKRGKITVKVGENSVWVNIQARLVPHCVITLTDMKIDKLNKINVDITNLGIFERVTDDITSWVTNEVTKWYRSYIGHVVYPEVAKFVTNSDLCHYLPI